MGDVELHLGLVDRAVWEMSEESFAPGDDRREMSTEFGGDQAEFQPESKGGALSEAEKLRLIYRSDPMDEAGASEIISDRVV